MKRTTLTVACPTCGPDQAHRLSGHRSASVDGILWIKAKAKCLGCGRSFDHAWVASHIQAKAAIDLAE